MSDKLLQRNAGGPVKPPDETSLGHEQVPEEELRSRSIPQEACLKEAGLEDACLEDASDEVVSGRLLRESCFLEP
jgi:hypothetical protein